METKRTIGEAMTRAARREARIDAGGDIKGPSGCTREDADARRKARQRLRKGFMRIQCVRCGVVLLERLPEAGMGLVCGLCCEVPCLPFTWIEGQ